MAMTRALIFFNLLLATNIFLDTDADNIWSDLGLPEEHMPYYFYSRPEISEKCQSDPVCPYKSLTDVVKCWGYESDCEEDKRMSNPRCPEDAKSGWAKNKEEQINRFWKSADFGYVKERMDELTVFCKPEDPVVDSYLACSKYTRYCRAKNIFLDFTEANLKSGQSRFREDVFKPGQVGGHCQLNRESLLAESEHKSPLQSWFAELEEYRSLNFTPIEDRCDVILDKPTILIKLDAGVNMFHHFCDYINLYASQHLNGSFSRDIFIVMWDTSPMSYGDFFHDTWKAFTDHPIIHLNSFDGKKVCIRDAVFSLLARMRYGLYYNMPLIPGCYGSGLLRAFSQHVLHRLNITQIGPLESKVRVTLLSRSTKYRIILNQDELVSALKSVGGLEVNVVDYNSKYPFLNQLQMTHNSDVFIGMHGAGLTHMLFQPDWAVVFELYNCDDMNCYLDLSRLRGIRYITWQNAKKLIKEDEGHHPTLGAHEKFTNYEFDVKEFMRLILVAVDYVRNHPRFIEEQEAQLRNQLQILEKEL